MAKVPNGVETLKKISTDDNQTAGRRHSELETFANIARWTGMDWVHGMGYRKNTSARFQS